MVEQDGDRTVMVPNTNHQSGGRKWSRSASLSPSRTDVSSSRTSRSRRSHRARRRSPSLDRRSDCLCLPHAIACFTMPWGRQKEPSHPSIPGEKVWHQPQWFTFSAAEIWSPGRQMRPMNPPGDPRSYHRWSVWRPMDALGFSENVLEWKCRGDSTDALISNLHCSLVKCRLHLVVLNIFDWFAWSQQIIDWRTNQNWDGPPNQQP